MNAYMLIIIAWGRFAVAAEFNSQDACEHARTVLSRTAEDALSAYSQMVCLPK